MQLRMPREFPRFREHRRDSADNLMHNEWFQCVTRRPTLDREKHPHKRGWIRAAVLRDSTIRDRKCNFRASHSLLHFTRLQRKDCPPQVALGSEGNPARECGWKCEPLFFGDEMEDLDDLHDSIRLSHVFKFS